MYNPRMNERVVNSLIRGVLRILCRVDFAEVRKLPLDGPYLLAVNHINFLDIPVLYLFLQPRRVTALVKKETWNNPVIGRLGNLWRAIPLHRGGVDTSAMRRGEEYLNDGGILFIAPEGTRSGDGILKRGRPGIVPLTLRTGVPVYPVAHFGGEDFWQNIKRLRRTKVTIRVGSPFRIDPGECKLNARLRQEIVDLVMYRIAGMMPEQYRGEYTQRLIEDGSYLKDLPGLYCGDQG